MDLCLTFSPKFYDAADTSASTANSVPGAHYDARADVSAVRQPDSGADNRR